MKKGLVAVCLAVPACVLLLTFTATHDAAGHVEDKKLAAVNEASVERFQDNLFRITVEGSAGSPGWVVNLHPRAYNEPPEIWIIEAVGVLRPGLWAQVVTEWKASVDLYLPQETQRVSVVGGNKTISMPVPPGGLGEE